VATEHLNAMNAIGNVPWNLTFSYGRALQDDALKAWAGKTENVPAGQKALAHRSKANSLATSAGYKPDMESDAA
jgi:fructose-bisphosphate aldolase class I